MPERRFADLDGRLMGRHSASPQLEQVREPQAVGPVTDPRLFDRPLSVERSIDSTRPSAPPRLPLTAPTPLPMTARPLLELDSDELLGDDAIEGPSPFDPISVRARAPRTGGPVVPDVAGESLLGSRRNDARHIRPKDQRYARTGEIPVVEVNAPRAPVAFMRKRETALAAAALAIVGAISGAAALLPSNGSEAEAATKTGPIMSPVPRTSGTASSGQNMCFAPQQITHAMRKHHHRSRSGHTTHPVPLKPVTPVPSTTTTGASASASPTSRPSVTSKPISQSGRTTGTRTAADAGTVVSSALNGLGLLPTALTNLLSGIYSLRDFSTQSSGAVLSNGVLKGAGVGKTVVRMLPNSSSKAAAVPGNGNNQGGLANPTNPLYLLRGVNVLENATVQGTQQGHLYNGVYMAGSNIVIRHVQVNDIPGDSNANPGETFAVNVNRATGTNTVDDLAINGGSGSLASSAGLAINNSDADWNISDLTTRNLKYSAGIALWQVRGTLNVHDYVQTGGARSLGAERLAGKVNLYDPVWSAGTTGHDVTYTWDGGYSGGSINFYYSSAAKVPDRKIQIITNKASGIAASVHVYIGGVQQTTSKYVTVS